MVVFRPPIPCSPSLFLIAFMRGLFGSLALVLLYYALSVIPVGLVTTLFSSNTILTFVMSHMTLDEPLTLYDISLTFVALVGVCVLSLSSADVHDAPSIMASLLAAVFSSMAYVLVRASREEIDFMWFVVSFGFCGTVITGIIAGVDGICRLFVFDVQVSLAFLAGIGGFFANCTLNKGLSLCNAGEAALVMNLEVPLSYFLGGLVVGEWPSAVRAVGAIMIMVAVVGVAVKRMKQA